MEIPNLALPPRNLQTRAMLNQVLLGLSLPYLLGLAWYTVRHGRATLPFLVLWPLAMAAGGLWAVLPDIPRVLGMGDLYLRLSFDPRTDIFFWHYTIDQAEHASPLYAILALGVAASVLTVALRELRARECERGAP